ncbi:MAG: flavodoxin family protein [Geobacteraceae bacterium]|nr:flavodoxin family protein [Geobacteraceae bacterium]
MNVPRKVTAIIGSYRAGRIIDSAVDEILSAAEECGAEVTRIYLRDRHIEFCTNCRACTQQAGIRRGACPLADDMDAILDQLELSDAIVLACPVNFGTVTAAMKRFMERLVCYACWPWGTAGPRSRNKLHHKRAVIVVSSAAPAMMIRLMTGTVGILKKAAGLLGAKTVGVLTIGLAALQEKQDIAAGARKKARHLGKKLVS